MSSLSNFLTTVNGSFTSLVYFFKQRSFIFKHIFKLRQVRNLKKKKITKLIIIQNSFFLFLFQSKSLIKREKKEINFSPSDKKLFSICIYGHLMTALNKQINIFHCTFSFQIIGKYEMRVKFKKDVGGGTGGNKNCISWGR